MKTDHEKSFARHFPTVARVLLGLLFFASGLANLLNLAPPPALPEGAAVFADAMTKTGYMMPLIFGTQFIVGTLLLANRFVPLALALLAPFIVNSVAFHSFLEPSGRPIALTLLALEVYLAWTYRKAYHDMLLPKTTLATRGKANRPEQPDEGPVIDDIRRRGDLEDMLQLVRNDRDERRLTLRTENFDPKVADSWPP